MGVYFPGFLNGVSAVSMILFLGIRSLYLVCHDVGLNGDLVLIGFFLQTLGPGRLLTSAPHGLFALDGVVGSYLFM
jgi:hypothetical protein